MSRLRSVSTSVGAFLSYAIVAIVFHWPLTARLGSALTGDIGGDTGVYVWNLWVFRHEIVTHRRFPLFTGEILSLTPPTDLSLHNYTLFADTLAFPLLPVLGVTVTFNVIFLAIAALTAWSMYLLARRVVGPSPEAWLAGLLFGFSPVLVARGAEHFSLAAAAPLPIFVLCLIRLDEKPTTLNAVAAGATIAWAATCDPYFAIYCLLIAACYAAVRTVRIRGRTPGGAEERGRRSRALDMAIALTMLVVVVLAVGINLAGISEVRPFGLRIALSMHTPVLALMVLVIARVIARTRPRIEVQWPIPPTDCLRVAAAAMVTTAILLSPLLYTLSVRLTDGGRLHAPVYWRSGPKGIDLVAFFMPNPGNMLFGAPARAWLAGQNNGYTDNVAALTVVATLLVVVAVWRYRFRPPPLWTALAVFFGALALGPFLFIGGVNTYLLGPWAVLRYVPLISAARMPGRFAIVTMMAFAIVFALALRLVRERWGDRRGLVLAVISALLAFELAPLPRELYAAAVPEVYRIVAADSRDVRVLGIPLGFVDGEGGVGLGDSAPQYYQTFHQKRIIGGRMSRISERQRDRQRAFPVIRLLLQLSERRPVTEDDVAAARRAAPGFIKNAQLGYVVIDTRAASPQLREMTIGLLNLEKITESEGNELYRPRGMEIPAPLQ
jgi:hypothetical protein